MPDLPPPLLTRRHVLWAGVLGTLAPGAGCSAAGPATPGGSTAPDDARDPRQATPTPDPAVRALARAELDLAAWIATLPLLSAATVIPAAQRQVLAGLRQAHLAHGTRLLQDDPLSPVPPSATSTPAPTPTPGARTTGSWPQLAAQLARREQALAAGHRAACLAAPDPGRALVHGSLGCFAAAAPGLGVAPAASRAVPGGVAPQDRTQALQLLLGHLRALVQGLQVGVGQLPTESTLQEPGRQRLDQVFAMRDAVVGELAAGHAEVPPAELGYRMPGGFGAEGVTRRTWGLLEGRVLAAWARVLAASQGAQRGAALDQMTGQARRVDAAGVPLAWWPGWV